MLDADLNKLGPTGKTTWEDDESTTREERISKFNDAVDMMEIYSNRLEREVRQSFESGGKVDRTDAPLSDMQCIPLARLDVGKAHRGYAIYCKIVSKVYNAVSVVVLVEDESALTNLTVCGNFDSSELREGRLIAIIEPFRMDGSQGIRVDNPVDLIFDMPKPLCSKEASIPVKPKVEERYQEILEEDSTFDVDELDMEGYVIIIKKKDLIESKSDDTSATTENSFSNLSSASTSLNEYSLAELQARKGDIKKQLKRYDMNFYQTHGRVPKKQEKETMRHLYDNYNALKRQIIHQLEDNGSSSPETAAGQERAALKTEKKNLHLMLHSYETGFKTIYNRQVLTYNDIKPVAPQYRRYKEIKRSISALQSRGQS